jgi:hypothetical protein
MPMDLLSGVAAICSVMFLKQKQLKLGFLFLLDRVGCVLWLLVN